MRNASDRILVLARLSTVAAFVYIIYVGTNKYLDAGIEIDLHADEQVSLEQGWSGKPQQVLLVSTFRSGSSFTGQLLASVPNSMYYFEPIKHLSNYLFRIEGPPQSDEAFSMIRNLLNCNNSSLTKTELGTSFFPTFNSSTHLRGEKMKRYQTLCQQSPFHIMKLVRLHLNLVESLLAQISQLRVLYLVRDPRGTLNSRWKVLKHLEEHATVPTVLCVDLVSEFYAAERLQDRFSDRFKVVRYEDLAGNTSGVTEEIMRFLGLRMHPKVIQFIDEHTHEQRKGDFKLNRNSSYTATRWTTDLSFDKIAGIQEDTVCRKALQLWGYKMMSNVSLQLGVVPYLKRSEYNFEQFMKTNKSR